MDLAEQYIPPAKDDHMEEQQYRLLETLKNVSQEAKSFQGTLSHRVSFNLASSQTSNNWIGLEKYLRRGAVITQNVDSTQHLCGRTSTD